MRRFSSTLVWISSIVAAILAAGYFFWPEFVKLEDLRREEKKLGTRLEVEERKNQLLRHEEEELQNNPDYVEKVAREKLGLIKPGEVIYKFDDENQE